MWGNEVHKGNFAISLRSVILPFGTNFREWLKIQNLDPFPSGPSPRNSWPRGFPHLPQEIWNIMNICHEKLDLVVGIVHHAGLQSRLGGWESRSPQACHLQRSTIGRLLCLSLDNFGDGIRVDGVGECGPGCVMWVLLRRGEELISTLGAGIHTWFGSWDHTGCNLLLHTRLSYKWFRGNKTESWRSSN